MIEWDEDACDTIRENQRRGMQPAAEWPQVEPTDVTEFDFSAIKPDLDLIAGGVPCQPWSLGGKHKGFRDERNLFPATVKIVRELRPKAVIIENVKGLTRKVFHNYYQYIQLQLSFPEITQKDDETWSEHLRRLQQHFTSNSTEGLQYRVVPHLMNAADHGVPQRRERVFIVAFRSDLGIKWGALKETHSQDALIYDKYVTGEYWDRVGLPRRKAIPDSLYDRVQRLKMLPPIEHPWQTAREKLKGLPDPVSEDTSRFFNHVHNPGARSYPGHTGSPLDEPAKTLKAGVHKLAAGRREHSRPRQRASTVFYGSRSGKTSDLPRRLRLPLVVDREHAPDRERGSRRSREARGERRGGTLEQGQDWQSDKQLLPSQARLIRSPI